jgi:hypothetical protein
MKRPTLFCTLLATLFLTSPAHAAWFTARIDRILISPAGGFSVYFPTGTNHECGSNRVDFSDPNGAGAKLIFAALLAYEAQKAFVQFAIQSCSGTVGIFSYIEGEPGL